MTATPATTAAAPPPVRTSRADRNLLSCSEGIWQAYSGTPDAEPADPLYDGGEVGTARPQDWDAILKVSRTPSLRLARLQVQQGRENALDCNNRCSDCVLDGDWGVGGGLGDQVITTKGGCQRMTYSGTVHSEGRNGHIVCGQWSDQSHDLSTDIDYSQLRHVTGKPLTFVLVRCARVKLPPGGKVLWVRSLLNRAYWWAKFAAVKLGLFR